MRRSIKFLLLFSIAILLFSCTKSSSDEEADDDGTEERADCGSFKVINGTECKRSDIPVVFIEVLFSQGVGKCTGTVIGRNHVITAAHCLINALGARVNHDNGSIEATAFNLHPLYDRGRQAPASFDISLLAVPNVESTFGITRAAINLAHRTVVGDLITFIGYGDDGGDKTPGSSGFNLPNGNPRVTDFKVIQLNNGVITTRYEDRNTNACNGDSGAAAFIDGKIVGIESRGIGEVNCRAGGVNQLADIQTDANVNFIRSNVPDARFE